MPSQSKIATIWYCSIIPDNTINHKQLISFYNQLEINEDLQTEFRQIFEKSGDNHTTYAKIITSLDFIKSKTLGV